MHQYKNLNFSRRLTEAEINDRNPRRWYMTHQGAIYLFKPGKVRVGFNASPVFKRRFIKQQALTWPKPAQGPTWINHSFPRERPSRIQRHREILPQRQSA